MPKFRYEAVDFSGEVIKGQHEAASEQEVANHLRANGLLPLMIVSDEGRSLQNLLSMEIGGKNKITAKQIEQMTAQLARLLKAGLPLDRALSILISVSEEHLVMQRLLSRIQESVRGGGSLATALETSGGPFSKLYINMVRAGEMSGALDVVLLRLSEFMSRARQTKDVVVSAMIYPCILFVVAMTAVIALLVFVVPKFESMFKQSGQQLPLPTRMVIACGDFLTSYGWLMLILVAVSVFIMRNRLKNAEFRQRYDRSRLSWPLFGDLMRKAEIARFSRTLGTLLQNGVAIVSALSIVKETITNTYIAEAVSGALDNMKGGKNLSQPLQQAKVFPPMALHMIRVGEETGNLESMLLEVADIYDDEVKTAVRRLVSMLEPSLIIGMGGLIAFIVISIMMAMIKASTGFA